METAAAALLGLLDSHISPRARIRDLGVGDQQLVEIAKALAADARLLLLDEPTSALSPNEIASLLAVVRRLTAQGIGIVFVSHRIAEVYCARQVFETVGCVFLLGYAATAWSRVWYAVRAAIGGMPPARAWGLRRFYQTSM